METADYVDKENWPRGPWQHEHDLYFWTAGSRPCVVLRMPTHGALCGYVAIPRSNPLAGTQNANEIYTDNFDDESGVHGVHEQSGITWSEPDLPSRVRPHVVVPEPVDWWIGFDCAHTWDILPGKLRYVPRDWFERFLLWLTIPNGCMVVDDLRLNGTYRSADYAIAETKKLARQMSELEDAM